MAQGNSDSGAAEWRGEQPFALRRVRAAGGATKVESRDSGDRIFNAGGAATYKPETPRLVGRPGVGSGREGQVDVTTFETVKPQPLAVPGGLGRYQGRGPNELPNVKRSLTRNPIPPPRPPLEHTEQTDPRWRPGVTLEGAVAAAYPVDNSVRTGGGLRVAMGQRMPAPRQPFPDPHGF
jgi:hypothetical protein